MTTAESSLRSPRLVATVIYILTNSMTCVFLTKKVSQSAGFGAFMFFVAFAVFLAGAVYISPVFCGSNAEKKMVSKPQEIESGEIYQRLF